MDKLDFLLAFEQLLGLGSGMLKGDETLSALNSWDSLTVLSFIAFADRNFGIVVAPADVHLAETVNDLINLLGDKIT